LQSFKNLKVWEKAHVLTLDVYKSSKSFPRDEVYGLTSQMQRSAASIGANIAEGSCTKGDCEFGRFLQIAMGSASELEYHLLLPAISNFCGRSIFSDFRKERSR